MIGYKEFLNDLNETNFKPKIRQGEIVAKSEKNFESRVHYGIVPRYGMSIALDGEVLCSEKEWNGEIPERLQEVLDSMIISQDKSVLLSKYNQFVKLISKK